MNVARLVLDSIDRFGTFTSTYFEGQEFTNVERVEFAAKLAAVLQAHGVKTGDRVVVMMPNGPEVMACFHAIWRLGAVIVPVTPQLLAREVAYIVANSGAELVLTKPGLAERVREALRSAGGRRRMLVFGNTGIEDAHSIEAEVAAAAPVRMLYDAAKDDLAILIYTSGTTGQPKGVMQTHDNLLANTNAAAALSLIVPQLMTMHVLPLSHVFGVLCMNLGAVIGSRSVILPHFETRRAFETIQTYRVQRMAVVPSILTYMLNFPDRDKFDCSSLELVSTGGAANPEEVRSAFERVFKCRVKDGYGCSESTCAISGYRHDETHRVGSSGRPIAGIELAILDDNDRPVPVGQDGEICVKGQHVMKGYWQDPEATAKVLRNGWLHTGDVGRVDADGFVSITGRIKDLIIKGGENIAPKSIEEALYEHPAVAEAAVVGIPDPVFGENVCAVVALKAGRQATEVELQEHVARYVSRFKVPVRVVFRAELPKSSVGKVLKRELRKELAEAQPSAISYQLSATQDKQRGSADN